VTAAALLFGDIPKRCETYLDGLSALRLRIPGSFQRSELAVGELLCESLFKIRPGLPRLRLLEKARQLGLAMRLSAKSLS